MDFEELTFPPRPKTTLSLDCNSDIPICERTGHTLGSDELSKFLDSDGRLVDEHQLRKAVFRGGCDPSIRSKIWQFLFRLYPFNSTERERAVLLAEYTAKYVELKKRWKILLEEKTDTDGEKLICPSYLQGIPQVPVEAQNTLHSPGQEQKTVFLQLQAKVNAERQKLDWDSLLESIRIIDKDVPRTDRDLDFFKGANPNLVSLREILITFSAYHGEVGYVQGMNDLVGLFLQVFENEVEAYWCFEHYMSIDGVLEDFLESGMQAKLNHVKHLLQELDPDLMKYLEYLDLAEMIMCHRWMLLSFKREFSGDETLKCFEILRSQHLEVYSVNAEKARDMQQKKNFMEIGGTTRAAEAMADPDYTFDVFMCVTILIQYRDEIFHCTDPSEVFQFITRITKRLNLDVILQKTEILFYKYCKKAATDCFDMLEAPSPGQNLSHSGFKSGMSNSVGIWGQIQTI